MAMPLLLLAILITTLLNIFVHLSGDAYFGWQGAAAPLCPHPWGAGGARITLHTKLFLSLLSCEGAFSSVVDSLVHGSFLGPSP